MRKILVGLCVLMAMLNVATAQRVRTTAVFDADTTTRPKAGWYGVGVRSGNAYLVAQTGNSVRLANYALFTGLGTNVLPKWNGSKLVNSAIFENGGNVGIGTASPASVFGTTLEVYGASTSSLALRSSTITGYLYNALGYFGIGTGSNHDFNIETNSISRVRVLSNGNVGIGTVSPLQKTHINTSLGGVPIGLYLTNDATNATLGRGVGVLFGGTGNTNIAQIEAQTLTASNNTGGLIFRTANAGTLTERMRIDQNGNVGVETTSPLAKLQIGVLPNASGAMSGTIATYAGSLGTTLGNSLKVASFGFAASNSTALGVTAYRTANGSFFGTTAIGLGFDVDNSSYSVANGMWFNATGQVGVGVVTPDASAKLHISSTTQGVLITRGTTTQINAIASPANGLMVYNTTLNKICVYENGSWKQVSTTAM